MRRAFLLLLLAAFLAGCTPAGSAKDDGRPEGLPQDQKRKPGEDVPPL